MTSQKTRTGNHGESLATDYLRTRGYTILETQWRCRRGEIDIIAQQDQTYVFVEVKTRRNHTNALSGITPRKRERLIAAVHAYLNANGIDPIWRIDAIGITLHAHAAPQIEHVEDALGW